MLPEQKNSRAPQLDLFRRAKQGEIATLCALAQAGKLPQPYTGKRPSFGQALLQAAGHQGLPAVIAEYKRASPSRGDIAPKLLPEDVASQYAGAGAACLSVLTEESRFRGELGYLQRMAQAGLPLLRKDFLFHPLQIVQTAATPASALLLIVRLTPEPALLRELREKAESFGMEAVVEVFDEADLALARASGARLIQVNARDLESFAVDRKACLSLAKAFRQGPNTKNEAGKKDEADRKNGPGKNNEIWIAASGLDRREHLVAAAQAGFDAVLVGTALMEGGQPGKALASLMEVGARA